MPEPPIHEQQAPSIASAIQEAVCFHQQGRLKEAEQLYQAVLGAQPGHFEALHFLGILRAQQGDWEAAARLISLALERNPRSADAHSHLGNLFYHLGRHDEALASYDKALAIGPDFPEAFYNRGNALQALHRYDEAIASYDRALALRPAYAEAHNNRANVLQELRRYEEAVASYDRCLAINPYDVEALNNRGSALHNLKRHDEAIASCDRALAIKADHVHALNNRGNILQDLGRYNEALACYDRALTLKPDYPEALSNRGNVLQDLGRYNEALACYDRALALQPDYPEALNNHGDALLKLKRPDEAARSFHRLLEAVPDYSFAKGELLYAKMASCDWEGLTELAQCIENDIQAGKKSAEPFGCQAILCSAQSLRRCAEIYAGEKFPSSPIKLWNGEKYRNARIRIGYVSGEFCNQATSILMTGLFERHDRNRFELFAFDNGLDDASEIRGRIRRAFDEMVDITRLGDREAAAAIKQRKIDILVNLNGYFGRARQGIFSLRPCPIQVNYLGFPGTLGADCMDYILADRHVIPPEDQACYTEKVVYLPECYQPNDSKRAIAERTPTRAEARLPDSGFVFCCFNNNYKITPEVFDSWMRLLKEVPGSILWLLEDNAAASRNLRREAEARGVAPGRLVFASRMNLDEHLARHRLADLFLDTLPYNAHTTGSDALWAGLPLLTCQGTTFSGRVAASLLHAVGLLELITRSLDEYEARALELAASPAMLADIRVKLARNRTTYPLFDTDRFRHHIESAYITMWERTQRGEPPTSFAVQP